VFSSASISASNRTEPAQRLVMLNFTASSPHQSKGAGGSQRVLMG
jgi:hypothetical protein